jgi:predicted O-methyltransferase YrrM
MSRRRVVLPALGIVLITSAAVVVWAFATGRDWAVSALVGLLVLVVLARQEMVAARTARQMARLTRRTTAVNAAMRDTRALVATSSRQLNQVAHGVQDLANGSGVRESLRGSRPLDVRLRREYEQVQATLNLFGRVRVEGVVPPMRGWAASPDVLNVLVDELLARRPRLVVECGSGVSTLWLALAIRQYQIPCRVVSLDHDPEFLAATASTLERHGVADLVELRLAPLVRTRLDGHDTVWYDEAALADLSDVGLVFVDGPPESSGSLARFPALPLIHPHLADDAVVLLDDAARADEQAAVARWLEDFPDLSARTLPLEKGAVLLWRGGSS